MLGRENRSRLPPKRGLARAGGISAGRPDNKVAFRARRSAIDQVASLPVGRLRSAADPCETRPNRSSRSSPAAAAATATIEDLWNGNSKDLLIMPSSIPIDDNAVKNELVRFLDHQWEPIHFTGCRWGAVSAHPS